MGVCSEASRFVISNREKLSKNAHKSEQILRSRYALGSERFCQCHSPLTEVVKSLKDLIKKKRRRTSVLPHSFQFFITPLVERKDRPWAQHKQICPRFLSERNYKTTILTFKHILCVCVYAHQIPGNVCVWVSSFTHLTMCQMFCKWHGAELLSNHKEHLSHCNQRSYIHTWNHQQYKPLSHFSICAFSPSSVISWMLLK